MYLRSGVPQKDLGKEVQWFSVSAETEQGGRSGKRTMKPENNSQCWSSDCIVGLSGCNGKRRPQLLLLARRRLVMPLVACYQWYIATPPLDWSRSRCTAPRGMLMLFPVCLFRLGAVAVLRSRNVHFKTDKLARINLTTTTWSSPMHIETV